MYVAFTQHYACGYNVRIKALSNGCNGDCTRLNIIYNKSRDTKVPKDCIECIAAKQLQTPLESSNSSVLETSKK